MRAGEVLLKAVELASEAGVPEPSHPEQAVLV